LAHLANTCLWRTWVNNLKLSVGKLVAEHDGINVFDLAELRGEEQAKCPSYHAVTSTTSDNNCMQWPSGKSLK
jgi:hypothetical protein